jgi:hypothetical protein
MQAAFAGVGMLIFFVILGAAKDLLLFSLSS